MKFQGNKVILLSPFRGFSLWFCVLFLGLTLSVGNVKSFGANFEKLKILFVKSWKTKLVPLEKPEYWRIIVNDSNLPFSIRRESVFHLFRRHIKVGMALSQISKLLDKPRWLQEKDIRIVDCVGGKIPVHFVGNDTIFALTAFLEEGSEGKEFLDIYLRFSGEITKAELSKAIFENMAEIKKDPRLMEMGFGGLGLLDFPETPVPQKIK